MSDNTVSTIHGLNSIGVEGREDVSGTPFKLCSNSPLNVCKGNVDEGYIWRGSLNAGVSLGASSAWGERLCFQTADSMCQPDWVVRFCIEHPEHINNSKTKDPNKGNQLRTLNWLCLK